jgi:hypothetical protein
MAATVEEKIEVHVIKQGWIKKKGMNNFGYVFSFFFES